MPVLAFMSFGGALLAMMALTAGVTAYFTLATSWWKTRATWMAVVLIIFPVLVAFWIWWDLRQAKRGVSIDILCKDPGTGDHLLILVHSDPWTEDGAEWPAIQSRLNGYVGVAILGRRRGTLIFDKSRPTRILLVCRDEPGAVIVDALRQANEMVRELDVSISWRTRDKCLEFFDELQAKGANK